MLMILKITESKDSEDVEYEDCGEVKCSKLYGECTSDDDTNEKKCVCLDSHATYPENSEKQCNYKRKKQLTAFLLEFFVTYGAGHFYTKNYKLAIPKLVVFVVFYCLFIVLRIISKAREESKVASLIICITALVCLVGMLCWQLYDLIQFGRNKHKDGNGIKLFPM